MRRTTAPTHTRANPPVRTPLPAVLPDHLPDYAPGRIRVVANDRWPLTGALESVGVRTTIPRYGLDVVTARTHIDAERVRWLTERAATRPLDARHVHLVTHRGVLYLVDGHHALAAHLITGTERIPVKLFRAKVPGNGGDAGSVAALLEA
jgi:hypothetical protein